MGFSVDGTSEESSSARGRQLETPRVIRCGVPLIAQQSTFLAQVGGNVRRLRVGRKLTQERLAELVGVNPRTIQKIEAGKLNILATTLGRLKEALRCDWDDLMRGAEVR